MIGYSSTLAESFDRWSLVVEVGEKVYDIQGYILASVTSGLSQKQSELFNGKEDEKDKIKKKYKNYRSDQIH